jgi:predicted MPP superfamily phosphohydrolase
MVAARGTIAGVGSSSKAAQSRALAQERVVVDRSAVHTVSKIVLTLLPYLQLQLSYMAASGALVLLADFLCGRSSRLKARPRLRALATLVALAVPLTAWVIGVKIVDDIHSTYQFIGIAFGFYAAAIWLPLLVLVRMARRHELDRALAAACTIAILGGQYSLWIEPNRLATCTYTIAFPQWPADEPPLRVVHISDLQTVGECAREHRVAATINAMHADLIVFTGDYVSGPFFDPEPAIAAARAFLTSLDKPKYGIVCIAGHSESEKVRARVFDGLDVRYLRNEELRIDLGGSHGRRELRLFGARTLGIDLSKLAAVREPGVVNVVATHEPDVSWDLQGRNVDLHLAGHTHGGQIAFPWIGAPLTLSSLPNRFARGLHEFGDHLIHVNPGIGMEGDNAPRIRFLCPPEVDLLLLEGGGEPRRPSEPPSRS